MDDSNSSALGIAIVGMSGRFPGAKSVDEFWQNLVNGVDSVSHFSQEALEHSVATEEAVAQGQKFVRARSILDGVDLFDAAFFGMYPKEAQLTDPQHRLFLECAWEALESAGHAPESYPGLISVYAGLSMNTYLLHNLFANRAFARDFTGNYQVGAYQIMLGNDKDFLPTRVSYKLNLRGPSMAVQTACSTSLVAICQACVSLMTYQCDMALAGGASITFPQKRDYLYQEEGMVSADGTCRSFDADACGTVFGHGVAVVLLKRLEDAIAEGDHVLAVIKGTAVNNDGSDKIGYAAPSVNAQADVIAMAQAAAGVEPDSISYIEAHGTATPLGDPIEVAALTDAFRRGGSSRNQFCALGTGKTHIGHLDVAAGATGVIKTVLQLQNSSIPSLLHFQAPNPKIDFENSPFFPVSKPMQWSRGATPRRAGVSAFGVGGTNAHIVLEEAPEGQPSSPSRQCQLLLLSAKTEAALEKMSHRLASHLEGHPEKALADVAFTLQRGRQRFAHRQALCAGSSAEAVERLRSRDSKRCFTARTPEVSPFLVFLFPGQGAQRVDMARELYEHEATFRDAVDRCAEFLRSQLEVDVRSVLYPDAGGRPEAEAAINQTLLTQPSIFVVEYALACLWMAWGIKPSALVGHSVGEYVAAVLSGVFTLEEALGLLASRAKLMQGLPSGSMLAVRKGVAEVEALLPAGAAIAAVNSPSLTTVSGPAEVLNSLQSELESRRIACRLLSTSHAFHSAMMDPIVEPFARLAGEIPRRKPNIPWISTLTGTWMDPETPLEPGYWARQMRETVRFSQGIEASIQRGATAFLEVGPGQALSQCVRQQSSSPSALNILPSLGANDTRMTDLETITSSLGRLWLLGFEPDWERYYSTERRLRVPLPTYPFERVRHWIEPAGAEEAGSASVGRTQDVAGVATRVDAVANGKSEALRNGSSDAARIIEKQLQVITQQIQMLREQELLKEREHDNKQ